MPKALAVRLWEACLDLRKKEVYHERVGVYYWPHIAADLEYPEGPAECGVCTNGARIIASMFEGRVSGYPIDPSESRVLVGAKAYGHDFAVVGHYIVDWWGWQYECSLTHPVITVTKGIKLGKYKPVALWHPVEINHIKPQFT